jgi:bifunctional DNA-binding transcriptional regulator/antitoxin component of YhaV-PrlF toxin-antitoxin module
MSIVKQFGLKQGDKLEWTFEVKDGEIVVLVRPLIGVSP